MELNPQIRKNLSLMLGSASPQKPAIRAELVVNPERTWSDAEIDIFVPRDPSLSAEGPQGGPVAT